jgi:hypothetical protein
MYTDTLATQRIRIEVPMRGCQEEGNQQGKQVNKIKITELHYGVWRGSVIIRKGLCVRRHVKDGRANVTQAEHARAQEYIT